MSLPIILAIVLVVAILAWVVVYLVVRQRREAAVRRMFQADPIDAEIGREALRRVFGILADEDPVPPPVSRAPEPSMAAAERPPMALGPAGAVLGSAGRSAAVAPATLARPDPLPSGLAASTTMPAGISTPAQAAVAAVAAVMASMAAKPASPLALPAVNPAVNPVATPPIPAASVAISPAVNPAATPADELPTNPQDDLYRLFAPDDGQAAAAAVPLLPMTTAVAGGPAIGGALVEHPYEPPYEPPETEDSGGRRRWGGFNRPRLLRDSAAALLVAAGLLIFAVVVVRPQLSIFSGAVSPATATAPAIAIVSPSPAVTPSPLPTPSPTPSATPSPSPSPSPSFSPSPTPRPTPRPTPVPTPVPTPIPTPTPKPTPTPHPTPTPTPTPPPPLVTSFTATNLGGCSFSFSGTYTNATSWQIDFGEGGNHTPREFTAPVTAAYVYQFAGNHVATLTVYAGSKTNSQQAMANC